jgi:hypothetical protein
MYPVPTTNLQQTSVFPILLRILMDELAGGNEETTAWPHTHTTSCSADFESRMRTKSTSTFLGKRRQLRIVTPHHAKQCFDLAIMPSSALIWQREARIGGAAYFSSHEAT